LGTSFCTGCSRSQDDLEIDSSYSGDEGNQQQNEDAQEETPLPANPGRYAFQSIDEAVLYSLPHNMQVITFGRANDDMRGFLQDRLYVSRIHASIRFNEGRLSVRDEGSKNGTYVNGARVERGIWRTLNPDDEIGLGCRDIAGSQRRDAAYFRLILRNMQ